MRLQFRRIGSLLAAGALVAVIASSVSAADESRVRVLHASPDAPAVDVHLDGSVVEALTNVPFGTLSGYLTVPSGEHQIEVFAAGTTENPVIDATVSLSAGTSYTVAATNALATIEAQVIEDNASPTSDGAQVRVVHFSADAPAVDVAADGAAPADAIVKNLSYPNATDYLTVPGDTYDLEVRVAGTTTVALQLDPVDLATGSSYSVFAIGSLAAGAENALQVVIGSDGETLPDTSTIDEPAAAAGGMPTITVIALVALGIAFLAFARFLVTRPSSR